MKRGFWLACFVLMLALGMGLPAPTRAAGEEFEIEDGILKKYNGSGGDVVIPEGGAGDWGWSVLWLQEPDGRGDPGGSA